MHFFVVFRKKMHEIESFICNNAAFDVICVKWVIEFTWAFGDYFDMMIK